MNNSNKGELSWIKNLMKNKKEKENYFYYTKDKLSTPM